MNLIYRLKQIYMNSKYNSISYMISQYLLINISSILDITINDISDELGISKSVISKFCLQSGCKSFSQFKYALYLDYKDLYNQLICIKTDDYSSLIDDVYSNELSNFFDSETFILFLQDIYNSDNVVLLGDMHYLPLLSKMTTWLLFQGINARELYLWNIEDINNAIDNLTNKDVLLLVYPNSYLNQFLDYMQFYNNEIDSIKNASTKCYFLGQKSPEKEGYNFLTLPFNDNKFFYEIFLNAMSNNVIDFWRDKNE